MTTPAIFSALQNYVEKIQETSNDKFRKDYPSLWESGQYDKFSFTEGGKYFKIIMGHSNDQGSVFCFVHKETGDIYKAETWYRPAKHVRGSIFNKELPLTLASLYIRH